jgi:putative restriction endonuclease
MLVSKPKGIYKPGDLPYALSIRINLGSPYSDGVPVSTPGGGWLLSYHQENADPADRDKMFTNQGLMRCIADQVPVGVLRERAPARRRSAFFGRSSLGAGSPGSGRHCWRPTRDNVLSAAAMRP